jgi:ATP-dependent Clp protease ATP-binding subunit ClpC
VLDHLLPYIEQGDILVVGEVEPSAYEQLVLAMPRYRTALQSLRIEPLSRDDTLSLARRWAGARSPEIALLSEEVLREAWQLTQQYLGDQAAPGSLLSLLELTWQRLVAGGTPCPAHGLRVDDLIDSLTHVTGLPAAILDERQLLDLDSLRAFFAARVMSQPEAAAWGPARRHDEAPGRQKPRRARRPGRPARS